MGKLNHNMNNKKIQILSGIVFFSALIIFIIFNVRSKGLYTENSGIISSEKAKLQNLESSTSSVIINTGKEGEHKVYNTDKSNVLDALLQTAKVNQFTVEIKKYDFGTIVTKIGDKANSNSFAWFYKVNGKMGEVGADMYLLKPGDKVEWYYEKIKI
jgi:hypothetical protein